MTKEHINIMKISGADPEELELYLKASLEWMKSHHATVEAMANHPFIKSTDHFSDAKKFYNGFWFGFAVCMHQVANKRCFIKVDGPK